jgi:hypothetical protein
MGKLISGNPFMFTGTVGEYVGSIWRGVHVVRKKPGPRTTEPTALQLAHQARFSLMIKFLRPLNSLLNRSYDKYAKYMTGFNKAFSCNKKILTGEYPSFGIDYSKVMISRGSLPNVPDPTTSSTLSGQLDFKWVANNNVAKANASDGVFVAAYCPDLDQWIYKENISTRSAGSCILDVTAFAGKTVQTYIGFVNANKKIYSNSQYTGLVTVAGSYIRPGLEQSQP